MRDACEILDSGNYKQVERGDLLQECIGETAERERTWIPMCREYPNLKGVTCDQIHEFIEQHPPDVAYTSDFQRTIRKFKEEWYHAYEEAERDEYGNPVWQFFYGGEGGKISKELKNYLKDQLPLEDYEKMEAYGGLTDFPTMVKYSEVITQEFDRDRGWHDIEPRGYTEDYLHHVKVYDRDEEYEAFRKIGDVIAKRLWNHMPLEERADKLQDKSWNDLDGAQQKYIKNQILLDPHTIYVTSPRGGLEVLGTFSYANDIKKEQIPNDILNPWDSWDRLNTDERAELILAAGFSDITSPSTTWSDLPIEIKDALSDYDKFDFYKRGRIWTQWIETQGRKIDRIIIVDDIVASGEQIETMYNELREWFGDDVDIYSVHLCHRYYPSSRESPLAPYDTTDKEHGHAFYDTSTIGIDEWNKCRKWIPLKKKFNTYGWDELSREEKLEIYQAEMGGAGTDVTDNDLERFRKQKYLLYGEEGDPNIERARFRNGMRRLFKDQTENCVSDVITCAFPHSIPDGTSDKILRDLYGGRDIAIREGRIKEQ